MYLIVTFSIIAIYDDMECTSTLHDKKIQKKIMGDLGMLSKVIHKTILLPDAQV
jgi:hypothetical protein